MIILRLARLARILNAFKFWVLTLAFTGTVIFYWKTISRLHKHVQKAGLLRRY